MSFDFNKVVPNSKKMDFTGAENQCSGFPEIYRTGSQSSRLECTVDEIT